MVASVLQPSTSRANMVNPKKRPASEQAQPAKSKAVRPSAKRRVERRIAGHQEYLKNNAEDFVRHDPVSEASPDLIAYHDHFLKAERACLAIPQELMLSVKPDNDPQLAASLRPKLNEVMDEYQSEPERVAVVGKTGQGKSKLIDAILGIDGIARSAASGVATTRIPIVYSPRRAHVQIPYEVRLEVSAKTDCRDSVQQHLANLAANLKWYEGQPLEFDEQGQDSINALQNLFSDLPEFASIESISSFLGFDLPSKVPSVAKQKDAFDQCVKWAEERRQKIVNMSAQGIYATNMTELRQELAQFSDDQTKMDDTKLGFNPSSFVERIEVFGDFRIRYSIGDCPGLQDINKDRETKANRYLQDCKVVVVAEEITRAGDSAFLDHLIKDRTIRRPDQRIIIVLTKGESNLNPSDRKDALFNQHEIADLDWLAERKVETRRKKDSYAPTDYAQRDHCAREIAFITLEEHEICARERGRRISDRLRQRFAKYQNENLTVMTTSAIDYMQHVEGYHQYTDEHLPLSVESTGIPTLCKELAAIANDRLQKDLLRFYNRTLPELFSFIQLACSTTSTPVQSGPRFNFEDYASGFLKQLEVFLDAVKTQLIDPMIETMRKAVGDWKNEARDLLNRWRKLHGNAVRTYLMKLGNHRTRGQPEYSWNILLLRTVQQTLDPLFKDLIAEVSSRLGSLAYQLEGDVDNFLEALLGAAEQLDSNTFGANLDDKKPQLYNMFNAVGRDLLKFIRLFRGRLTEDGNGDFFPQQMKKVYGDTLEAKPMARKTMKEVQMQTLEACMCGKKSPYDILVRRFDTAWKAKQVALMEMGRQAIAFHIAEIKASYKQLSTPELQDDAVTLLRAELERKVGVAREQCKGPILTSLLECGLDPNLKKVKKEKKVKREKKVAKVEK